MFDFQDALLAFNGEHLSLVELQQKLSELRSQHLSELPPEIGVKDLLLLALERHWIEEEPSGTLRIHVPEPVAA